MESTAKDKAHLWKSKAIEGVSLLKARFFHFEYRKHTHDGFAVGVIENGTQRFNHKGSSHIAPRGSIITVNPDEVHDGRAAADDGYQYRVAYIDMELIEEILRDLNGIKRGLSYFTRPVNFDTKTAIELHEALLMLEGPENNLLESQGRFMHVLSRLFRQYGNPRKTPFNTRKQDDVVRRASEFIYSSAHKNISLEDIAHEVGVSRFHLLRIFKAACGLPPHAYLIQRRLMLARTAIENGSSLVEAAVSSGFSDQSHLTRRFKTAFGVTPGQYQNTLI